MKNIIFGFFALILLSFASLPANAASEIYSTNEGVAIEGYDTVAYFTNGIATKGDPEFKSEWNGASWFFANAEHRDLFDAEPEKYAPQYGGYCAFGAANNFVVSGAAERWRIVDNKLYLNTNLIAKKLWENNIPNNVKSADQNWPGLHTKIKAQ